MSRIRLCTTAWPLILTALSLVMAPGCGSTRERSGTEQLLLSDAVDRSVGELDFSSLSGRRVYLDTSHVTPVKGLFFVNAEYIASALRHRLITSGVRVLDDKLEADYIVEVRMGALGNDANEVTYGIPANSALSQAASLLPSAPAVPTIPEISVARRDASQSTAKLVAFAYHRESGAAVWQSGSSIARSTSRDMWFMGAGPFQRGSIHKQTRFAGTNLRLPFMKRKVEDVTPVARFDQPHQFMHPAELEQRLADAEATRLASEASAVEPASHEETKPDEGSE